MAEQASPRTEPTQQDSRDTEAAAATVPSPPLSADSPLPRRRNGKPQSCEPCRKAKVSCDHGHPKCGRCVKKGIPSECVYHPAPLTRTSDAGVTKRRTSPPSHVSNSGIAASNLLLMLSQQRATPQDQEDRISEPSEEYLGPTNYAAVFRETHSQIGIDLWRKTHDEPPADHRASIGHTSTYPISSLNIGIDVLSKLPDQSTCERLFQHFHQCCDMGIHGPTVTFALREFWSQWGTHMKTRNYRPIAERLLNTPPVSMRACRNSAEWVQSFTGENLRFEMVGVFLSLMSLSALTLPVWDKLFNIEKNGRLGKKLFAQRLGDSADACYDICNDQVIATEPLIWLMYFVQISQSQYRGDDDGAIWPKAGLVASAITTFGLHREGFVNSAPFMVAEIRRRTFASSYIADKQLSTWTGRPPRLSKRYCSAELPRDLTDEEIMAEGEQLEKTLSSLDENGWNTDGVWRPVAVMRLFMLSSLIRDEVLELCLGPPAEVSESRKYDLVKRIDEFYQNVPHRFHLPTDDDVIMALDSEVLLTQLIFRVDYLFNKFLVLRLPNKGRSTQSMDQLIETAVEILDCMSFITKYRNKMSPLLCDQGWTTVYYAIPSASILSIELLKLHQYPHRYHSTLPRAKAIRLLSIYLLTLSSVGPEEGNYKICQRMHKVVSRVLDEVLEPPTLMDTSSSIQTPSSLMPDIDLTAVMAPNDDPEFMNWLQTVDWTKAPWIDPIGNF